MYMYASNKLKPIESSDFFKDELNLLRFIKEMLSIGERMAEHKVCHCFISQRSIVYNNLDNLLKKIYLGAPEHLNGCNTSGFTYPKLTSPGIFFLIYINLQFSKMIVYQEIKKTFLWRDARLLQIFFKYQSQYRRFSIQMQI